MVGRDISLNVLFSVYLTEYLRKRMFIKKENNKFHQNENETTPNVMSYILNDDGILT